MIISPLLLVLAAAIVGALVIGYIFARAANRGLLGAALGAGAGALGSLIFMIPLDYCMFEAERKSIDVLFGMMLIVLGVLMVLLPVAWLGKKVLRRESLVSATSQPTQGTFRHWWIALPLLAPTLAILLLFLYYPSLETLRLSTMLSRLGARREAFVCVDNYTRLFEGSAYLDVVARTVYMSFFIVVLSMALGLLIATMAYLPVRGASIYRVLLVWPYAISPAVAGIIFLLMLGQEHRHVADVH